MTPPYICSNCRAFTKQTSHRHVHPIPYRHRQTYLRSMPGFRLARVELQDAGPDTDVAAFRPLTPLRQSLRPIQSVRAAEREVQLVSTFDHIVGNQPRSRGNLAVPRPDRFVTVTIVAGAPGNTRRFRCRPGNIIQYWWIRLPGPDRHQY